MGQSYSIGQKTGFDGYFDICGTDVPGTTKLTSMLQGRTLCALTRDNNVQKIYRLPEDMTRDQLCAYSFPSTPTILDIRDSWLVLAALGAVALTVYLYRTSNDQSLIVGAGALTLALLWRALPPSTESLPPVVAVVAMSAPQVSDLNAFSKAIIDQVKAGTVPVPIGPLRTMENVEGLTTVTVAQQGSSRAELITLHPNVSLPLHRHNTSPVLAVAMSGTLEITRDGFTWLPWASKQTVQIPAGALHAVRSGADGATFVSVQSTSGDSVLHDFIVAS